LLLGAAASLVVLLPGGFLDPPLTILRHQVAQKLGNEVPPLDMHLVYAMRADYRLSMHGAGADMPTH
jgi:hypothetical protein